MHGCSHHHHCATDALTAAESLCASQGLKFTESRRDVFSILWGSHKALTAAEVMEKLGNDQPPVTYRALDFLQKHGLIHHVASINAYIGCTHVSAEGQAHSHVGHLLVCETCHDVQELAQEKTTATLQKAAETHGFHITEAHVELLGRCNNCAAA